MKILFFTLLLALLFAPTVRVQAQEQQPPEDALSAGVVRSQRLASGVPLGGVGAGTFQLLTDGTVSRATLTNNWSHPTGDIPACFAAFWAKVGNKTTARVLALRSPYGLPTAPALDFDGLCPQATLDFPDAALPVQVSLRAFSPLVPFDIRNSSFPAAAFLFRLRNASPLPVEVSVALSWENILGMGGTVTEGAFANRTGSQIAPYPAEEGFFGLKFLGPPPTFRGSVSERLRDNATGEMALLTLPPRGQAAVTSAGWNALAARPSWWDEFAKEGKVSGSIGRGEERTVHPAGVLAVHLTLRPNDYVEIPFAVAWYTPRLYTRSGVDYGHYYQNLFPDAADAGRTLLSEWRVLYALTDEWQKRLVFSNLPRWQVRRLINSAAPLIANTLHTRDGRFAMLTSSQPPEKGKDAPADNGTVLHEGRLATLDQRLPASALLLAFFPHLNATDLTRYSVSITADGLLPPPGDWEQTLDFFRPASRPTPFEASPAPPDDGKRGRGDDRRTPGDERRTTNDQRPETVTGHSATRRGSLFVLETARHALMTGDRAFLASIFPEVRRVLSALLDRRAGDGLPALPEETLTPAAAMLWLAALRAGERLAIISEDTAFARVCEEGSARAAAAIQARFWQGAFFAAPGENAPRADQTLGLWFADSLNLGSLLADTEIDAALRSLLAGAEEAGGRSGEEKPSAPQSDLAALLLGQAAFAVGRGKPEAGVALWERLDTFRSETLRSPYQSPAYFNKKGGPNALPLSSLAHAADWNLLPALEGFRLDLFEGLLVLSPRIPGTWRSLTAPVFAPTFWGRLDYKPTARGGSITLRVDRLIALQAASPIGRVTGKAELALKAVRVPGPPPRPDNPPLSVFVSLGPNPIGHRVAPAPSGDLLITFETPLTLNAGDRLEIHVR